VDYLKKIEEAIEYIEDNLTGPLTVRDVSDHVFQSRWHFQRIFRSMTGCSLYSYIRKRRLSEAAGELLTTGKKVIDVALRYQYETPETFLREFKKEYGMTPSTYRTVDEHSPFERINLRHERFRPVYEAKGITWRPVVRKETHFIGQKYRTTMQNDRSYTDIPAFWADATRREIFGRIPNPLRAGAANGIYTGWDLEDNFDFLVGAFTETGIPAPEGYVRHVLPEGTYMQFTIRGNQAERILLGWKYIYGTWFAETGYEHGDADDFDHFDERFYHAEDPRSEIYVSIR
jgi:AraC family transcriptional regulator